MRKQNQAQSEHYKMYKKGKQWLFALVTLFGVGITANLTTVHAATDSGQPAEAAASPTSNPMQEISLTTSSASGVASAASAPASQQSSGDTSSTTSPTDSEAKSVTTDSTTSTEAQQQSATIQATASDQKMATSTAPDLSVASQTTTQAASSTTSDQIALPTMAPTAVRMNTVADGIERVSLLATDAVSAADQPTAPTLTGAPSLSNFYVNGATVTYNQSTTLSLNHIYNPSGSQQLYGVYVVLPPSVMGASLSVIQQAANNLVTTMQNEKYSIASMTVYQLPNSVSGREVYYLRPNDGANAAGAITAVEFDFPIQTGLATDPAVPVSWQMNANTNDQLITNTVMFAGASNYTSGGFYPTVSATTVGIIGAVDQNVQGIVYSGIARSFSYKHSTIVDTYNVIDGTTGKQITSKAVQGLDGSSYSRATPSTGTNTNAVDTLASLGLSSTQYDQASMTINSGTFSDTEYFSGDTTGTGSSFPGSTYTITVYENAAKVAVNYAYEQLDANGNPVLGSDGKPILTPMTGLDASSYPTEATYPNGTVLNGTDVNYVIPTSVTTPPTGYTFASTQGSLTGALLNTPQTVTVIFKQDPATVTVNYYAVDPNGNPYYSYDVKNDDGSVTTQYTTDSSTPGAKPYLLNQSGEVPPLDGFFGDTYTTNAPAQVTDLVAGLPYHNYYQLYGTIDANGVVTKGAASISGNYGAGSNTIGFYYVRQVPTSETYTDTLGNVLATPINQAWIDGQTISLSEIKSFDGTTIDWDKSIVSLVDTITPSAPESIRDFVTTTSELSQPATDAQVLAAWPGFLQAFSATKVAAGMQFAAVTINYVYKLNVTDVILQGGSKVYDGQPITAAVTAVTTMPNGLVTTGLSQGTDYTVSGSDSELTNVGLYTVTLTKEGLAKLEAQNPNYDFTGITASEVTTTYKITPAAVTDVTLQGGSKVYDGQPITAAVTAVTTMPNGLVTTGLSQGTDYTVSGSDSELTNVGSYTVTLTKEGLAKLEAQNPNYDFTGITASEVTTTYKITPAAVTDVTLQGGSKVYDGQPITAAVTAVTTMPNGLVTTGLSQGTDYTVSGSDSELTNVGSYTVTLTKEGLAKLEAQNPNYDFTGITASEVTTTYKITPAAVIDVTLQGGSKVYDGQPITAAVTAVTTMPNGLVTTGLSQGTDYTVSGSDSELTNVGSYTVTLTKEGLAKLEAQNPNYDFTGITASEVTTTYKITPAAVTDVTLQGGSKVYDGQPITAAVTAVTTMPNGLVTTGLSQGTDYTVSGSDSELTNVGSYTVTLTKEGLAKLEAQNPNYDFTGITASEVTTTYKITPAAVTDVTLQGGSKVYDGQPITAAVTAVTTMPNGLVTTGLSQGTDYTVSGSDSELTNVGLYTVTLTKEGLAKLEAQNPNYDFTGITASEVTTTYKITPAAVTDVTLQGGSKVYDGQPITAAVTAVTTMPNGLVTTGLSQGTDYTVSGSDSELTNVGSYTVTLTKEGLAKLEAQNPNYDFTGITASEVTTTYKITPAAVTDVTLQGGSKVYDGQPITAAVTAVTTMPNGLVTTGLSQGTDYTVSGSDSELTNVGSYTVTLTKEGLAKLEAQNPNYDFTGITASEVTTTYKITPAAVIDVTLQGGSKVYDGQPITAAVTAVTTMPNGLVTTGLSQGTDYTVSGSDSELTNVGSYTVTLTTEGLAKLEAQNPNYDFTGITASEVTTTYKITPAAVTDVTLQGGSKVYDGQPITAAVTAVTTMPNGLVTTGLSQGTDYTVSGSDSELTNVGSYTVTLTKEGLAKLEAQNPNYDFTGITASEVTTTYKITPAAVTDVTLQGGSKVYDGNAIINAATVTLPTGLTVPELTQGIDYLVTGDSDSLINAGKYKVVLTQAGLEKLAAANDNYDFSHVEPTDVTGQYVINKAQATITGNNLTHIYDGNTVQPTATVTGAVNGETITYDPLTVVGPNVGQYNFTPTASDTAVNKNYNFTYKLGTVTITQAALTQTDVDLTSGSKTYDGQAITDATTVVLPTGLTVPELTQNTDYLVTGTDEQLINAGNYTITLTQAGLDKLAKANTNYDFSHVEPNQVTAQYVVNKATATIAGVTDSKTYDGQTAQPLATITGAVNGEKLVYTIGEVGPNAGTYDFTPTADKDAAVNQNYDITVTGAQYTINKATATITGDNVTHVYDGNTVQPTATITGAVNGETLSYDPLAAVGPNVGHYNFAPTASDVAVNQNYNFVYNPGTVTITPAPLTQADVSLTGGEKTYDAAAITNAATVTLPTGLTVPTLIQGTDYDVTGLDANLKNAGSYTITLTQAGLDKLAAVNDNYDFSQINPALVKTNYVVHKATATLTGNSQTSVFNGQQVTPMATVTGAVDGETITYAPIQAVGPDVGTYYFIPQATNDAVNANYDIKVVAGTIVIQPAIVTAVTLVGSTKTYDGQTITKAASVKLPSGLVAPELMQGVDYTVTGLDPDLTNAGSYTVTLTAAGLAKLMAANSNYDFSKITANQVTTTAVINKANATIAGNDVTHVYDGNTVTPTATVTGAVNGETIRYNALDPVGPNVGQYAFTPTASDNAVNQNYNFTYEAGKVTITQAPLPQAEVALKAGAKIYDGQSINNAATGTLPAGLTAPELTQGIDYLVSGADDRLTNAGTYKVTLTQAGLNKLAAANTNYDFSGIDPAKVTDTYTVSKAHATITGITDSKTYDGGVGQPTAMVTGVVAGEQLVYTIASVGPNAGTYDCVPTVGEDAVNQNYEITVAGGQYTINKANATIAGNDVTHVYDGNTVTPTATVTGAVNGETIQYGALDPVGPNVGQYAFTPTASDNAVNQNYNFTYETGTVTITQAALTQADVTLQGGSKTYNGQSITNAATITLPTGLTVPELTQGTDYLVSGADDRLTNAGTYNVTLTQAGLDKLAEANANYDFSQINPAQVKGHYVVNKALATLTTDSATKVEGNHDPQLTATVTGLIGQDQLNYTVSRVAGENPGQYQLTVAMGDNPNYDVRITNSGSLTILAAVTVNYVDQDGNSIAPDQRQTLTGQVGSTLTITAPTIAGYTLMPGQPTRYVVTNMTGQTVTLQYRQNASVTAHYYLVGTTQQLADSETQTSGVGLAYTTKAKAIAGYTLVATPSNATGLYAGEPTDVNYYYTVDYTVVAQTPDGTALPVGSISGTGTPGEAITGLPTLSGYTLTQTPVVPDQPGQVVAIYTPNTEQLQVNYWLNGSKTAILPSQTVSGPFDSAYQITPLDIPGYTLVSTPANASGTFGLENVDVTYYYELNYTLQPVDENRRPIDGASSVSGHGIPGQSIDLSTLPSIPGYTLVSQTVNVPDQPGVVNVQYVKNSEPIDPGDGGQPVGPSKPVDPNEPVGSNQFGNGGSTTPGQNGSSTVSTGHEVDQIGSTNQEQSDVSQLTNLPKTAARQQINWALLGASFMFSGFAFILLGKPRRKQNRRSTRVSGSRH